jgi:hypothetical protein
MKIGDLVKLRKHCRNGGRMAVIVEMGYINDCTIVYVDSSEKVQAIKANLELLNESR